MAKKKANTESKKSEESRSKTEEPYLDQMQSIMNLCAEQQIDLLDRMNEAIDEQQKFYTNIWSIWLKFNDKPSGNILTDFGKERNKQISGIWNDHYGKINSFLLETTQKSSGKYKELFGKWRAVTTLMNRIGSTSGKEQKDLIDKLKKEYEDVSKYTAAFFADNNETKIDGYKEIQSSWRDFTNRMNMLLVEITSDEDMYKTMANGEMHQAFTPVNAKEVLENWNNMSSEINGEIARQVSEAADKFNESQDTWDEFLQKVTRVVKEER